LQLSGDDALGVIQRDALARRAAFLLRRHRL
jgi:hypothetical protein